MRTKDSQFAAATRAHAQRVAAWSGEIARELGLTVLDQELVRQTAIAHHYPLDCLEESGLARLGRDIGLQIEICQSRESKPAPAVYGLLQSMRSCGFPTPDAQRLAGIIEVANFWDEQLEYCPFSEHPLAGVLERTISAGQQVGFSPELLDGLKRLRLATATALDDALELMPAARPRGVMSGVKDLVAPLREIYLAAGLRGLWEHSITAARLAARIAEEHGRVSADDAFTAGLLHDVGRIPITLLGPPVVSTLERLCAAGCMPVLAEQSVCGFDHTEAGARVLERWGFPELIINSVRWHHEPERDTNPLTGVLYLVEEHLGGAEALPSPVRTAAALRLAGMPQEAVM